MTFEQWLASQKKIGFVVAEEELVCDITWQASRENMTIQEHMQALIDTLEPLKGKMSASDEYLLTALKATIPLDLPWCRGGSVI